MDLPGPAGDSGDGAVYRGRRRSGAASVELVAAGALRLAPDHPLAGAWHPGAVPGPVWRVRWTPRVSPFELSPPHVRALGTNDARGAGALPARHARTLRLRHPGYRE